MSWFLSNEIWVMLTVRVEFRSCLQKLSTVNFVTAKGCFRIPRTSSRRSPGKTLGDLLNLRWSQIQLECQTSGAVAWPEFGNHVACHLVLQIDNSFEKLGHLIWCKLNILYCLVCVVMFMFLTRTVKHTITTKCQVDQSRISTQNWVPHKIKFWQVQCSHRNCLKSNSNFAFKDRKPSLSVTIGDQPRQVTTERPPKPRCQYIIGNKRPKVGPKTSFQRTLPAGRERPWGGL